MNGSIVETQIDRVHGEESVAATDMVAVEEPLEIQLAYGPTGSRRTESIAVTMRTPGHDAELAIGFLVTEGVIADPGQIERIGFAEKEPRQSAEPAAEASPLTLRSTGSNAIRIELAPEVTVSAAHLRRNFYTTSSCGVCGKASLLALQAVCPPRRQNRISVHAETLYQLPARLRQAQTVFERTGGLHGAALFHADGGLIAVREDVGRHNAVDKLLGAQFLEDRLPLRETLLMLSGRASFELLQKAVMAGVPAVAAVGAPSSLAAEVARHFDVVLVGFLRDDRFNVYHGVEHLTGLKGSEVEQLQ